MKYLRRELSAIFAAPAPRKPSNPSYAAFRVEVAARGLTYRIADDGFIEFSDKREPIAHYGDWAETLAAFLAS